MSPGLQDRAQPRQVYTAHSAQWGLSGVNSRVLMRVGGPGGVRQMVCSMGMGSACTLHHEHFDQLVQHRHCGTLWQVSSSPK